ncbi:MAG: RNA-binding S4 domain-containing protein [Verrucomicrobiales bacterium]|nr:RNA-binding S4 domain-containing protein [Verrucomicrobiales bacterium]
MRLDQWLWSVRLYRTRTLAANAVRDGEVRIDGQTVKPARSVVAGLVITAVTGRITRTYRVLGFPDHRVGAPGVPAFAEDLTPAPPAGGPDAQIPRPMFRPRGFGRPTKRDRRVLERFLEPED